MKFCKNCKHLRPPTDGLNFGEYAHCMYGVVTHPVTGDQDMPTQSSRYCINLRKSGNAGDCGPEARFFRHTGLDNLTVVPSATPTELEPA